MPLHDKNPITQEPPAWDCVGLFVFRGYRAQEDWQMTRSGQGSSNGNTLRLINMEKCKKYFRGSMDSLGEIQIKRWNVDQGGVGERPINDPKLGISFRPTE